VATPVRDSVTKQKCNETPQIATDRDKTMGGHICDTSTFRHNSQQVEEENRPRGVNNAHKTGSET
jgi:hypothetical protein